MKGRKMDRNSNMNKLSSKAVFLAVSVLAAVFSGCGTMKFSGYPDRAKMNTFSTAPLYRVEPSTATPELWSRYFKKYEIKLRLDPEFPSATDHARVEVSVFDVFASPKEPVEGAKISARATMPNTPGYIRWIDNNVCNFNEVHPGYCEIHPIVFGTGGDWDLIVKVEIPGEDTYTAVFPVEVKGPPWPPNYKPE